MAKQNFLAGGYIGKLGQTVGQRWKDQKIIRTYVKPANPNTPAQQNARAMFATANKLAQEAMNINGHTGVWDTSTCPEYSQRVGQAMRRLRAGYTEQESLPLYPEGSIPEVQVTITDLQIDANAQIYTIYTDSYGISIPTAVELSFYSPEDYLNGNFTEYIIHGTVDATNKRIFVDCSANNTTDSDDVKNFFKTAISLGFVAFYPTFYDGLGVALTEIVMKRGYEVPNILYDFNKAVPIIDVTQKIVFQQDVAQDTITGTVAPPVENGYPFIAKVSSQNTYYGGFTGNSSQSSFITIDTATPVTIQSEATAGAKYLETANNETIYLQKGLATKQLYRDTSTQTFDAPKVELRISDILINTTNKTYSFYSTPYGIYSPTAVELTFYTPEDILDGAFRANVIHGTVNSAGQNFTIDCSANNTQDSDAVKTLFEKTMALGFISMYPSFTDAQGSVVSDVVIQRGYEITDKFYDFNKDLNIIDVSDKVELQQDTQFNMVSGMIAPPVENGYPFIARVTSQNSYYQGYADNTGVSDFITIPSSNRVAFTNDATANAKYLSETNNETIYLQSGATTKQLYRDTSTQTFQNPQITVTLTSVQYTAGSPTVYFTFDNPDALVDVPKVYAHIGYLQQGQTTQSFTANYRDLTRETDGRYSYNFGRNFTAEGKLIIYAYIQALNADSSTHDIVTISTPDYENGNLLYVSSMPSRVTYPYTLNAFPIDLYRTDGLPLTIAPKKGDNSELFVSLAWGAGSRIDTVWRNYSFVAGTTETTQTITSTQQVFTDVKETMLYQFFNVYEENGRKKVDYTFSSVATATDITATTSWTPANGWNIAFQFDTSITLWAKQVSAIYNSGFEGVWGQNFSSPRATISGTGVANMTISDDLGVVTLEEDTYMQPVFTFYDKNGTAITGVTGGGNTTPATGRIYFAKTPRVSNTTFDAITVVAVTNTYIDLEFDGFYNFANEVRLTDTGEILELDSEELIGYIDSDIATVISSNTIRVQASDTNPDFNGFQTNVWCYNLVTGLGANTTLFFNGNM